MTMIDNNARLEAVNRLFELVQSGEVESLEFSQLDSLIYEGLEQTYSAEVIEVPAQAVRAA